MAAAARLSSGVGPRSWRTMYLDVTEDRQKYAILIAYSPSYEIMYESDKI